MKRDFQVDGNYMNASVSNSTSDLDHNPNLNIIFVDSMSRTEFYYGMEKTSEALRSLSASGIRVLDFKLFQSLSRRLFSTFTPSFKQAFERISLENDPKTGQPKSISNRTEARNLHFRVFDL